MYDNSFCIIIVYKYFKLTVSINTVYLNKTIDELSNSNLNKKIHEFIL